MSAARRERREKLRGTYKPPFKNTPRVPNAEIYAMEDDRTYFFPEGALAIFGPHKGFFWKHMARGFEAHDEAMRQKKLQPM